MKEGEKILIQITEDDIKQGSKKECFDCPIAYGVIRCYGIHTGYKTSKQQNLLYRRVSVANTLRLDSVRNDIKLPSEIKRWIIAFDKGKLVKPFSFEIHCTCRYSLEAEIINIVGLE